MKVEVSLRNVDESVDLAYIRASSAELWPPSVGVVWHQDLFEIEIAPHKLAHLRNKLGRFRSTSPRVQPNVGEI